MTIHRPIIVASTLTLLLFFANQAGAQDQYDAGIFADLEGTVSTLDILIGTPFTVHAVAFELDGLVKAFELSINGLIETGAFVLDIRGCGGALGDIGYCSLPDFVIGTGGCVEGGSSMAMIGVTVLPLEPIAVDTAICLGGVVPSSFDGPPGYAKCNDEIVAFGVAQNGQGIYPDGCLIINPSNPDVVVGNEISSVGAMKARFR